jgi:hypothetical protein
MKLEELSFEELIDLLGRICSETKRCHWTLSYLKSGKWTVNLVPRGIQFQHDDKVVAVREALQYILDKRKPTPESFRL